MWLDCGSLRESFAICVWLEDGCRSLLMRWLGLIVSSSSHVVDGVDVLERCC